MTDAADFVDSLKRSVATAGTFAAEFPNTTDDDLIGVFLDGLAEAQLDGFFIRPDVTTYTVDGVLTPNITNAQAALIIIYAQCRMIRAELLNRINKTTYKAGPVEAIQEQSSTILTTILKEAEDRKLAIIKRSLVIGASAAFTMADAYFIKAVGSYPGGEFYAYGQDVDRAYDYHSPYG